MSSSPSQKPLTTDQALDSLSSGFLTSTASAAPTKSEVSASLHFPNQCPHVTVFLFISFFTVIVQKKDNVDGIRASSAGPTNFAPPPVKVRGNHPPHPARGDEMIRPLFFISRKLLQRLLPPLCPLLLRLIKKAKGRRCLTTSPWRPCSRLLLQRRGSPSSHSR